MTPPRGKVSPAARNGIIPKRRQTVNLKSRNADTCGKQYEVVTVRKVIVQALQNPVAV